VRDMMFYPRLYGPSLYNLNNYTKTFVVLWVRTGLLYSTDDVADTSRAAGVEEGRARRLAALRLPRIESDCATPHGFVVVGKDGDAALVLPGPCRRRAAGSRARDRASQPRWTAG